MTHWPPSHIQDSLIFGSSDDNLTWSDPEPTILWVHWRHRWSHSQVFWGGNWCFYHWHRSHCWLSWSSDVAHAVWRGLSSAFSGWGCRVCWRLGLGIWHSPWICSSSVCFGFVDGHWFRFGLILRTSSCLMPFSHVQICLCRVGHRHCYHVEIHLHSA